MWDKVEEEAGQHLPFAAWCNSQQVQARSLGCMVFTLPKPAK
jgi:hypothetical protein